jgi:hypothetical protein
MENPKFRLGTLIKVLLIFSADNCALRHATYSETGTTGYYAPIRHKMWSILWSKRTQQYESVKTLFVRQLKTIPCGFIRVNNDARRHEKTTHDTICGAFCGAR